MDQLPPGADLTKTPAGKPPPGVTPNFNDPPSLANATIAVAVVMMGLTMIFITVRLSAIVFLGKKAGIDDCNAPNQCCGQKELTLLHRLCFYRRGFRVSIRRCDHRL